MATLFIRHEVHDYDQWKAAYDSFEEARKELGVTGHAIYRDAANPRAITAYHDFETMDAAKSFAASPRLKEAMEGAGVSSPPEMWFAERA